MMMPASSGGNSGGSSSGLSSMLAPLSRAPTALSSQPEQPQLSWAFHKWSLYNHTSVHDAAVGAALDCITALLIVERVVCL